MGSQKLPYGSWPSPLSAARVTAGALRLDQIQLDGDDVYWLEGRASEGGRNVIVRRIAGRRDRRRDAAGFNVRTRVHEYGGGAYTVDRGTIFFSNFADQRSIGRIPAARRGRSPTKGCFYADFRIDRRRDRG